MYKVQQNTTLCSSILNFKGGLNFEKKNLICRTKEKALEKFYTAFNYSFVSRNENYIHLG